MYGICCRIGLAIERKKIGLSSIHWHGRISQPFGHEPFLYEQRILVVSGERRIGFRGINYQCAVETKSLLSIDMVMRVIEVCPRLKRRKLVAIYLTILDG